VTVDAVVDEVLAATERAVAGDPQATTWSWPAERWQLQRMCFDFINNKHPELVDLLPNDLLASWRKRQEASEEHVKVMWSAFVGKWCVTGRKPHIVVDNDPPADRETAGNDGRKIMREKLFAHGYGCACSTTTRDIDILGARGLVGTRLPSIVAPNGRATQ
jgi:hypothetical protein